MSGDYVPDELNLDDDQLGSGTAVPTTENQPSDQKTAEELEWSSLRGNAQERFQQLIRERNAERAAREAAEQKIHVSTPPAPPVTGNAEDLSVEEAQALDRLKKRFGIVTKDEVENLKQEITQYETEREDARVVEEEYNRLRSSYDGSNGLPKFSAEEVEDHMKRTGIYNPEKAFKDMYEDEFFDHRMRQGSETGSKQPYTRKPPVGSGGREEPLSLEKIQERMRAPDGRVWWEKNRDKVIPLMGQLTSES
jgi:hypothetical protein